MSRLAEKHSAASIAVDATALAARMNARPLPDDCDGGEWSVYVPGAMMEQCEACGCHLLGDAVVSAGNTLLFLCLPCALADCERAEAAPRTTANDGDDQDSVCRVCGDHSPCDCED